MFWERKPEGQDRKGNKSSRLGFYQISFPLYSNLQQKIPSLKENFSHFKFLDKNVYWRKE